MVSINISDIRSDIRNDASDLRPGFTARTLHSYFDMRTATEELLSERPSEARLLLFVLLSDMIFTLSWVTKTLLSPTASATSSMGSDVVLWLVVAIMMRTTAVYLLALGVGVVVKLLGGKATLHETRVGVIWGVFVTAPISLAISQLAVLINQFEGSFSFLQNESIQMMPYWLGLLPFVWFVAKGAAAANRLENAIPLFGTLSAIAVAMAFGVRHLAMV